MLRKEIKTGWTCRNESGLVAVIFFFCTCISCCFIMMFSWSPSDASLHMPWWIRQSGLSFLRAQIKMTFELMLRPGVQLSNTQTVAIILSASFPPSFQTCPIGLVSVDWTGKIWLSHKVSLILVFYWLLLTTHACFGLLGHFCYQNRISELCVWITYDRVLYQW